MKYNIDKINEWVERCETEHFLRKSSTNYTLSSSPGASVPYGPLKKVNFSQFKKRNLYWENGQNWKGDFLNTKGMWEKERGGGSFQCLVESMKITGI